MTTFNFNLNRRAFIGAGTLGAAASVFGTASSASAAEARQNAAPQAQGTLPGAVSTAAHNFIRRQEFFIAHRGAGDVNPEHTAYAYAESVRRGAEAVEISVRTTSDGRLMCMHDETLQRTTGSNMVVRHNTYVRLRSVYVNMRETLGEGAPLELIPTLDEALDSIDAINRNTILFIEAKDGQGQRLLLETIKRRNLAARTVVKVYRDGNGKYDPNSRFLTQAKAEGCQTWCYFDANDSQPGIQRMAASANVDAIGVPFYENTRGTASGTMSVENVRKVVGYGKPVIVWEIHRRSVHQRFRALGVRGFMCPDPYWITGGNLDPNLKLGEGRRLHGMIPAEVTNPRDMPDYSRGALVHSQPHDESVLLGPLVSMTTRQNYTLDFSMRWENRLPSTTWQYGYLVFGREHDGPFGIASKFRGEATDGCYVLTLRPGGRVRDENGKYLSGDIAQVLRYDPAKRGKEPVVLHTMKLEKPLAANRNIDGKIIVKKDFFYYVINGQYSPQLNDTAYRGPYVHFGRYHGNSNGGPLALTRMVARESWA